MLYGWTQYCWIFCMRCTHSGAYCILLHVVCIHGMHPLGATHTANCFHELRTQYCFNTSCILYIFHGLHSLLKNRADDDFEFLAPHAGGLHWSCKSFMRCTHNGLHSSLDYIHNNVDNPALIHRFSWQLLAIGINSLIFAQSIWNQRCF